MRSVTIGLIVVSLTACTLHAQAPLTRIGIPSSRLIPPSPVIGQEANLTPDFASETVTLQDRGSHWVTGALIGAGVGALLAVVIYTGLQDEGGDGPTVFGAAGSALVGMTIMAPIGALIGGTIKKN